MNIKEKIRSLSLKIKQKPKEFKEYAQNLETNQIYAILIIWIVIFFSVATFFGFYAHKNQTLEKTKDKYSSVSFFTTINSAEDLWNALKKNDIFTKMKEAGLVFWKYESQDDESNEEESYVEFSLDDLYKQLEGDEEYDKLLETQKEKLDNFYEYIDWKNKDHDQKKKILVSFKEKASKMIKFWKFLQKEDRLKKIKASEISTLSNKKNDIFIKFDLFKNISDWSKELNDLSFKQRKQILNVSSKIKITDIKDFIESAEKSDVKIHTDTPEKGIKPKLEAEADIQIPSKLLTKPLIEEKEEESEEPKKTTKQKTQNSPSKKSNALSTGSQVGIGIGVSLAILLFLIGLFYFLKKKHKKQSKTKHLPKPKKPTKTNPKKIKINQKKKKKKKRSKKNR